MRCWGRVLQGEQVGRQGKEGKEGRDIVSRATQEFAIEGAAGV